MKKLFVLLALVFSVSGFSFSQNSVSLNVKNIPVEQVLSIIEKQSAFAFSYNPDLLEKMPAITINIQHKTIEQALSILFNKNEIQYIIKDKNIILKKKTAPSIKYRTISGYIYDNQTHETIISATIFDLKSQRGTISNNYGFFSLTIPENQSAIRASYIGYTPKIIQITNSLDTAVNVFLETSSLQEVIVEGRINSPVLNTDVGKLTMNSLELKSTPAILSESDVLKTLQLTPGVNAGTEGIAGLYVRGGNVDENLYLVDGNPIYHVNHLGGLFSTFNPDAVKILNFYKGSFPARFGGRLSSVVDMRMNDGDLKKVSGSFSIGLLSSRINLQGPITKDKTSFNVSLRRTYLDLLTTPLFYYLNTKAYKEDPNSYFKTMLKYNFYDFNGKISHRFSDKNRLYLSLYSGKDNAYGNHEENYVNEYTEEEANKNNGMYYSKRFDSYVMKMNWGTQLASLNWTNQINEKLFSSINIMYGKYISDVKSTIMDNYTSKYKNSSKGNFTDINNSTMTSLYGSGIIDYGIHSNFDYSLSNAHSIKFGGTLLNHIFRPEYNQTQIQENVNSTDTIKEVDYIQNKVPILDISVYAEDEIQVTDRFKVNAGLHISDFIVNGKSYFSLQPRFSSRYLINNHASVKLAYAQMNQYLHLLQSSFISMPNDLWMPITKNIKPLVSHQITAGGYWQYKNFDFSMEAYYKVSKNQMEYKEGAELLDLGRNWEQRVAQGIGKAYGCEWLVKKSNGKFTGWAGYALSWATRQFPNGEINFGKTYFARFDNRHKINLVGIYKISKKIDVRASWIYASGNRITIPLESFMNLGGEENYIAERNNYRMPNYHRLDLSVNFTKQTKKGKTAVWNISFYNAYNQHNAFMIIPESETLTYNNNEYYGYKYIYKKVSIFPIIPSFSYTLKF